jgi:hypothetical protein
VRRTRSAPVTLAAAHAAKPPATAQELPAITQETFVTFDPPAATDHSLGPRGS